MHSNRSYISSLLTVVCAVLFGMEGSGMTLGKIGSTNMLMPERMPPSEYRMVKYIAGNNSAYLTVNWPASSVKYQRVRFVFFGFAARDNKYLFGNASGDSVNYNQALRSVQYYGSLTMSPPQQPGKKLNISRTTGGGPSNPLVVDTIYDNRKWTCMVGGSAWADAVDTGVPAYGECDALRYLFAKKLYNRPDGIGSFRIGLTEYWNAQGTPFSVLVPCVRRDDEKPGMYDLVRRSFYTNSRTTGSDFGWAELQ